MKSFRDLRDGGRTDRDPDRPQSSKMQFLRSSFAEKAKRGVDRLSCLLRGLDMYVGVSRFMLHTENPSFQCNHGGSLNKYFYDIALGAIYRTFPLHLELFRGSMFLST